MVQSSSSIDNLENFVCRISPVNCKFIKLSIKQNPDSKNVAKLVTYKVSEDIFLQVTGSSSYAAVSGLRYYLKENCNATFTEFGLSHKNFKLVELNGTIHYSFSELIHYYGNICAYSYSYWSWNWDMWQKHIDWIVFRGFNMVYVPIGIEWVYLKVFKIFGLKENKMYSFFNGPAFLAWSRMGNMKNFTAPLTSEFIDFQVSLHRNISKRFNELGIKIAIPGFSGFVPHAFKTTYNETYFNDVNCWNGFNKTYSCLLQTDPTKELYQLVGNVYMKTLLESFPTNHIYAVDMFNENTPVNSSLLYLQSSGKNTISVIQSADPSGVWLLQGWTFGYDSFWSNERVKSYLEDVSSSHVIILDMFAEVNPTWNRTESFYGKPFIWTMVNNFGGNTLINGNVLSTLHGYDNALKNSQSVIGFGFMPEGIYENTILLDGIMEFSTIYLNGNQNSSDPSTFYSKWKNKISQYRYSSYSGKIVEHIIDRLYSAKSLGSFPESCFIHKRPGLNMTFYSNSNLTENLSILIEFLNIIKHENIEKVSDVFLYDLSSVLQNYAELMFHEKYCDMMNAYSNKNLKLFDNIVLVMIKSLALLDHAFNLMPLRSLPCHLETVSLFALLVNDSPAKLHEDFRLQLTTWGYEGEILDYASKMWSGLLSGYYKLRWKTFFEFLRSSLAEGTPFNQQDYEIKVKGIERAFVTNETLGDCVAWEDQNIFDLAALIEQIIVLASEF